ncbi:MAG: salicylate-5-hydroxylase small oxygenase NagH [Betaproteobacteria bacterium]|nr:salicylate-5-hydroxylase small oxygenase NagH [Betaproteobacteria bacterium]
MSDAKSSAVSVELRLRVEDLYGQYIACLDEARFDEWPDFFTEVCIYKVMPRENYDRKLQLATMAAESRGMLIDRVYGMQNTLFHQPYYQRHIVSGLFVRGLEQAEGAQRILTQANYAVFRTKQNALSEVFNVGRYIDTIVEDEGRLRFAEKWCVFDSELIPNSMIYPI